MAKFLKHYQLVIILSLLGMTHPLNATPVQTVIHFGKNQTSKMWVGQLSPKQDSLLYQFDASKNQYATLEPVYNLFNNKAMKAKLVN
jgi:hypothetical protein